MSKKFWNDLIKETYKHHSAADFRKASWQYKHDIFFGKNNITWGLIGVYDGNTSYDYKAGDLPTFQTAADKFVKAAKASFASKSTKYPNSTKKYKDGFVVTIIPRAGGRQTGHAVGTTFVDPINSQPYNGAMDAGWDAAHKIIKKKLTTEDARVAGQTLAFLHGDDPSSATKGPTGKGSKNAYGIYEKKVKGKKQGFDKTKIGGRKTTIGTYSAKELFSDMDQRLENKLDTGGSREYEINAQLGGGREGDRAYGRRKKDLEKELDLIKRAQAIDETVLKLFTTQAQAAVLQYIDVELGWAMSRSGKGNTRAINITVDGSVGASSEQEKSHPWDFPIRSGEFKRTGIQGRLTAVMEKTTRDILKKAASKDMGMIRASETIGEIMESDLAGVTLNTIKKHFKGGKNVKVKVTRRTPKVKNNRSVSSKIKFKKQRVGPKGKITSSKTPPKISGQVPIAKSTGQPDRRYKAAQTAKFLPEHSPIGLAHLLNKALPDELKENMTGVYPKSLEWRTGRFAESALITQVVPFPRMTEIRYTYQKNPYQVFEPGSGNPLASIGRDPQQIIGGTIRELAQSIMGTRFGLVRTKRV